MDGCLLVDREVLRKWLLKAKAAASRWYSGAVEPLNIRQFRGELEWAYKDALQNPTPRAVSYQWLVKSIRIYEAALDRIGEGDTSGFVCHPMSDLPAELRRTGALMDEALPVIADLEERTARKLSAIRTSCAVAEYLGRPNPYDVAHRQPPQRQREPQLIPPSYAALTMTDYIEMRSFEGFAEGMRQACFLFDKLPAEEALSIVAAYQALRNVSEREGIQLIRYNSIGTIERERLAVSENSSALLHLAESRGVDVNAIMPRLRAQYTEDAENFVRAIRDANKPQGFFAKLFG